MNDGRTVLVAEVNKNPKIRRKNYRMTGIEANTPEGRSFRSMINRGSKNYQIQHVNYKGVTVCDRWLHKTEGYVNFLKDMGRCPDNKSRWTIDRLDNSKGYTPENCKWSTYKENSNNKRNNRYIQYNGETKTMTQWAEKHGLKVSTLWWRLDQGWSFEEAIFSPTRIVR